MTEIEEKIDEYLQKMGIDRRTLNFILYMLGLVTGMVLAVALR